MRAVPSNLWYSRLSGNSHNICVSGIYLNSFTSDIRLLFSTVRIFSGLLGGGEVVGGVKNNGTKYLNELVC